jgi:hypothetical protein
MLREEIAIDSMARPRRPVPMVAPAPRKEDPMITLFSALSLALMATAAPAAPPAGPAAGPQSTPAPACQTAPAVAAPGLEGAEFVLSFCQSDCTEGPDVSCNGTSCSAVDQNCSVGQQGFVQCDGNYTYCPVCPPSGGGCTRVECRMGCGCPGGLSVCVDLQTCECECIYE